MDKIQMVDLQTQYRRIQNEVLEGVEQIIENAQFINGPAVHEFADQLANYQGDGQVIPCGNGTDALQIAMMALDLKAGDEVITTPFTFIATAEVIALLGLKPVFVDVNPHSFNIDETKIEEAITDKTRCIVPVHLFGQTCEMDAIGRIAERYHLHVVEDNAQSIGADYFYTDGREKKSGMLGDIGATSFFPSKNLGAYGDGGALSTGDETLAEKIRSICNHGSKEKYYHHEIGVNSRLDTIQAHVLKTKLQFLDDYIGRRRKAAARYDEMLVGLEEVVTPFRVSFSSHVFHQYTLKITNGQRDALKEHLLKKEIPCAVYYPIPLHLQEAYKAFGYQKGDYPVSEKLSEQVLSLPMHTELSEEQQEFITSSIKDFFHG